MNPGLQAWKACVLTRLDHGRGLVSRRKCVLGDILIFMAVVLSLYAEALMMRRGFFICIEGLDKCGKTTQSMLLVRNLSSRGYDVVYTSEPTDGRIGRFIREYILKREKRISAVVEALLFAADRTEHTETFIKPNLEKGKIIVSDRYIFSSIAYQGAAGVNPEWIWEINRAAIKPDLAIYIDVPVDVIISRCEEKGSVMERRETQEIVRKVYLRLVRSGDLTLVNGNRTIEEIAKEIEKMVLERLESKNIQ